MMTPAPTQLVLGRYALQGKLAAGGMAEIWLARALGPDGFSKQVVVKRILPQLGTDPTVEALFKAEARVAARLDHPNLLHVFDFGRENDGALVLVMELVDGTSLRTIARAVKSGKRLDPRLAAKLIALACEGLHAAHQAKDEAGLSLGLIHRDISPENILLSRAGAVKVADFGIAKANDAPLTDPNVFRGKLGYAAPEQIQSNQIDQRADLWAIGCTLFELLVGSGPFLADTQAELAAATLHREPRVLAEVREDCPLVLSNIVARCLKRHPNERWPNAGELSAELERFISWSGDPIRSAELGAIFTTFQIAPHTVTTQGTPQPQPLPPTSAMPSYQAVEPSTFEPRAELAADGVLHELAAEPTILRARSPTPPPDTEAPLALERTVVPRSSAGQPQLTLEPLAVQVEQPAETEPDVRPRGSASPVKWIVALLGVVAIAALGWSLTKGPLHRASRPAPGSLFVETVPSGARVTMNGQPVGETPWAGQTATETTVVLSRDGFESKTLHFEAGADWSGTVKLVKKK